MTFTRLTDLAVDSLTVGGQPVGSGAGIVLLTSGTIASPVTYLDLALPAGYAVFFLQVNGITLPPDANGFAAAISFDGGATFFCDPTNHDSYLLFGSPVALLVLTGASPVDPQIADLQWIQLFPGSSSSVPRALGQYLFASTQLGGGSQAAVNPAATTPPPSARADLLRLLPFGNGDCDPPTSGETFTAEFYALWGVPTP